MARSVEQETGAPGQDSFLDIVTNMVGIMIIFVLIVSQRVKFSPDAEPTLAITAATQELQQRTAEEESLRADAVRAAREVQELEGQAAARQTHRDMLATYVAALEYKIRQQRESMDVVGREEFDMAQALATARRQLEDLERQRGEAENQPGETVVVESYPTPLSRSVDSDEAHFQLRNNFITYIPLMSLVERFKRDAKSKLDKLRDQSEFTDTVGPEGGFRLRYTMERKMVAEEMARGLARAQLREYTLIPTADQLGEPIDAALQPNSMFRAALAKIPPGRTAITIWLYPESYNSFRRIRKELYQLGYTVAARPLAEGMPIGGSPDGSKSAAQ